MQPYHRSLSLGAALTLVAVAFGSSPAAAMGRATHPQETSTAVARSVGAQNTTQLQSQVEALSREVAAIRARLAMLQQLSASR